jgi:hypothetical protein
VRIFAGDVIGGVFYFYQLGFGASDNEESLNVSSCLVRESFRGNVNSGQATKIL